MANKGKHGVEPDLCVVVAYSPFCSGMACSYFLRSIVGGPNGKFIDGKTCWLLLARNYEYRFRAELLFWSRKILILLRFCVLSRLAFRGMLQLHQKHKPNTRGFREVAIRMWPCHIQVQFSLPFSYILIWILRLVIWLHYVHIAEVCLCQIPCWFLWFVIITSEVSFVSGTGWI